MLAERFVTGVPGLDPIFEGGLLRGGVYIFQGAPGVGKTILGNQICFHHVQSGGRAAYVTLLAESHARMLAHLQRLAFFRPAVIPEQLSYLSAFKVLESEGLQGLLSTIRKAIAGMGASLVVLDGLISAQEVSRTDQEFKKFIHELQTVTGLTGCTMILLTNAFREGGSYPEHTMVDGVIELTAELARLRTARHLYVRKLRGCDFVSGRHTLEISDAGIRVHPRLETQLRAHAPPYPAYASEERRLPVGIAHLDDMLHGGLPASSMTMVLGSSGSGKTTLGLQWLAEGARRGEPGLFFGFFEKPAMLRRKALRLSLGLEEGVKTGAIEFQWQAPVEAVIDSVGERLLENIVRRKVRRLVIDSMQGFHASGENPERVADVFTALSDELEARGVTTLYTMETRELFGTQVEVPVVGVSAITHNIVLLRQLEHGAAMRRIVSVHKLRDGAHDSRAREFTITGQGIEVAPSSASAERLLRTLSGVGEDLAAAQLTGPAAPGTEPGAE